MKSEHFLRMYAALLKISKAYQTPDQIRRDCKKQYGLDYEEALEMAYKNLQAEARQAIKGIRVKKLIKNQQP